jgi:uncharacterized protein YqgC (DUF456 family)
MADIAFIVLGAFLLVLAFIGCVVPVVPGPLLAFAGLLCARGIAPHTAPSMRTLVVALAFVVVVIVLDYVVPALVARKFNCGKMGVFGCVVGTIVGLFFMPIGLLVGPFLGAMVGELIAGKEVRQSLKGAVGAFLGYAAGILLKLICCGSLAAMFMQATKTAT